MFCEISVLKNFVKFTGKTCAIALFLIKLQAENFLNIHTKTPVLESCCQHEIVDTLAFFYCAAYKTIHAFYTITQCALTHSWEI